MATTARAGDDLDRAPVPAGTLVGHTGASSESATLYDQPMYLSALPDPPSIYSPPAPPREDEGVNEGGVNIALQVRYLTDYVYRGVDHSEVGGNEDAPNLQFDGKITFDLGKLPHPFVGVFANVYNSDPDSRFQEIRPFFGLDWNVRPFRFVIGNNTYIYPERDESNTGEAFAQVTFDDSFLFSTEQPLLSPYLYAAYDYDVNDGVYIEAGVKHDFAIEDTGITVTAIADVAYVSGIYKQFIFTSEKDNGFSHFDLGLIGTYSLNTLFNVPRRFGEWSIQGYLYYTDQLDEELLAETQVWGGFGIDFKY